MKLFVVTRSGTYATETEIVRAESRDDIPAFVKEYPWSKQEVEELTLDGKVGVIYSNCYIE